MFQPDNATIKAALELAIEQSSNDLGESRLGACAMEDGDPTTLTFVGYEGEDTFMIHWYVPDEYVNPDTRVIPDDCVVGDLTGTDLQAPPAAQVQRQSPTTEAELGSEFARAAQQVRAAVRSIEYPTGRVDPFYVLRVQGPETPSDPVVHSLLSAVQIK